MRFFACLLLQLAVPDYPRDTQQGFKGPGFRSTKIKLDRFTSVGKVCSFKRLAVLFLFILNPFAIHNAVADRISNDSEFDSFIRISSGDAGSGTHQSATTLAGLWNWKMAETSQFVGPIRSVAVPMASAGPMANLRNLFHARTDLALLRADIADSVFTNPTFFGFKSEPERMKLISTHKPAMLHIVVRHDFSGVQIADLLNFRVSFGPVEANTLFGIKEFFESQGTPVTAMKTSFVPLAESLRRLSLGSLDAVVFFDQTPSSLLDDRLANGEFRLLTIAADKFKQFEINSKSTYLYPVAASDQYSNVTGIIAIEVSTYLVAQQRLNDTVVERINKILSGMTTVNRNRTGRKRSQTNKYNPPYSISKHRSPIPLHAGVPDQIEEVSSIPISGFSSAANNTNDGSSTTSSLHHDRVNHH